MSSMVKNNTYGTSSNRFTELCHLILACIPDHNGYPSTTNQWFLTSYQYHHFSTLSLPRILYCFSAFRILYIPVHWFPSLYADWSGGEDARHVYMERLVPPKWKEMWWICQITNLTARWGFSSTNLRSSEFKNSKLGFNSKLNDITQWVSNLTWKNPLAQLYIQSSWANSAKPAKIFLNFFTQENHVSEILKSETSFRTSISLGRISTNMPHVFFDQSIEKLYRQVHRANCRIFPSYLHCWYINQWSTIFLSLLHFLRLFMQA